MKFFLFTFVLFIFSEQLIAGHSYISKKNTFLSKKKKTSWAKTLANHPYYKRPKLSKEAWDKIPKADRPDLAFEQDYMMTMDPELGKVPYERKVLANQIVEEQFRKPKLKAAITGVSWVERGPKNIGGRTRAIMFDPNDANKKKVWAGAAGGGLWYTNDITAASPTWVHVDGFWDNIAISCIAYNPNNTQEIYVGTGEGYGNSDAQRGCGIWKSANGGATWRLLSSTAPGAYNSGSHFHYINKIVIKSNGTIFAATKGYYINSGGIMRSTDTGATWTRVLSVYTGSGTLYDWAGDIELAANGDLYASFGMFSQGKVYKCTNANNGASGTWTDISSNIGTLGTSTRIELACAPSDANVIYAVARVSNGNTDIDFFKKSFNGGTTWSSCAIPLMVDGTGNHFTRAQAWYDLILAVHPTVPKVVLVGGIDIHRSKDSGTSWTGISHWYGGFSKPYVHADQHGIIFRPNNNEFLFSNDGGIFYSTNAGDTAATPSFLSKNIGYNVTQYYACAAKNEINSHYFLAGAQDNGSHKFTTPQINTVTEVSGGDGAFCHIDQDNPLIQTSSYTNNVIYRSTNGGGSFPQIVNESTSGHFINPSDYDDSRDILYAATNNNLVKRVSNMSGTITNTDIAISVGTARVSALKVSPYNDVVFLGIENGRIYKFSNASTGAPVLTRIDTFTSNSGWVSSIDVGANDNVILITFSNYGVKSVWETTNGGTTWVNKEGNLPDMPIRWAIYNPNNRNQVVVATEVGVWSTDNFGTGTTGVPVWGVSSTGLAYTRCDMLQYRAADKMLVVATHGRGLFTSDIFVTTRVADFSYDNSRSCSGSMTVNFTDGSLKPNNTWAWDVDGNGTTDYTTQNPTHTYSATGLYSVKLKINGGTDSIQKNNIILVTSSGLTANTGCTITANSNSGNSFGIGISNVTLNTINNTTSNNDGHYNDYSCSQYTVLIPNTTYNLSVTSGTLNNEAVRAYIDYNNNNNLEASELIGTVTANMNGANVISFTTPVASSVTMNTPLRMRIVSKFSSSPSNACDVSTYGQAEDYTIYMKANAFALPVNLADFVGKCKDNIVDLNWATASEDNNEVFIIERSKDAIHYEPIGEVKGAGTSKTMLSYQYKDENPLYGTSYYRLKQRDFDGRSEFSKSISVKCIDKLDLKLFPNPTTGKLTIQGFGKEADISITNLLGFKLMSLKLNDNFATIDLDHLPNGIYNVSISNEDEFLSRQIVIRK